MYSSPLTRKGGTGRRCRQGWASVSGRTRSVTTVSPRHGRLVAATVQPSCGCARPSGRVVAATTEAPSPEVTLHCSPVRGDVRKSDSLMTDQVRCMARWSTLVDAADQAENSQAGCFPLCDRGKVCRSARSTRRARGHPSTERGRRGHWLPPSWPAGLGRPARVTPARRCG